MYGMTDSSRAYTKNKIDNQKLYLDNNFVQIGNQSFSYSQFFKNSFINSNRYIAEIQNRVNSLFNYSQARDLKNIFITLTLPTEYHPKKTLKNNKVIDNPRFINDDAHNPKSGTKELSCMFSKMRYLRSFRNIEKENRVYFRVTEPHKDGTPHLHISLFVPFDKVDNLVRDIKELFPKPASKIEINVKNPVAYLMKYILKTLDDLRIDSEKITDLTLWYIYHGICRIYTSRTLISLDIYRVLGGRYSLNELTIMYKNREIAVFVCPKTNKVLEIFDEFGSIWKKKKTDINVNFNNMRYEPKIRKDKKDIFVPIFIDDKKYFMNEDELVYISDDIFISNYDDSDFIYKNMRFNFDEIKKSFCPSRAGDYELFSYYENLDIEECNLQHFGLVQNECISRGLVSGYIQSLNDFNVEMEY